MVDGGKSSNFSHPDPDGLQPVRAIFRLTSDGHFLTEEISDESL
jgi:hypothetical protein